MRVKQKIDVPDSEIKVAIEQRFPGTVVERITENGGEKEIKVATTAVKEQDLVALLSELEKTRREKEKTFSKNFSELFPPVKKKSEILAAEVENFRHASIACCFEMIDNFAATEQKILEIENRINNAKIVFGKGA